LTVATRLEQPPLLREVSPRAGGQSLGDWQPTLNGMELKRIMPSVGPSSRSQVRNARTPAERMRLFRKRRKVQRKVVRVDGDPGEMDALIDRGYLDQKDRDDLEALAAAVNACFSDDLMTP